MDFPIHVKNKAEKGYFILWKIDKVGIGNFSNLEMVWFASKIVATIIKIEEKSLKTSVSKA